MSREKDKIELMKCLDYLTKLKNNWNGFECTKPTQLAIKNSSNFIRILPTIYKLPSKVSPDGEGGIKLYWDGINNDETILIVVIDDKLLHLCHMGVEISNFKEQFFNENCNEIPDEILNYVPC
jgi:hypothetical protein